MKRKDFLKLMSAGTGLLTFSPALLACRSKGKNDLTFSGEPFSRALTFPEEIKATNFDLAAETARRKLAGGVASDVYTLNGSLLPSPTIRVKRGKTLAINFQNRIDHESFIHWHGLVVPPDMDGHPKDAVQPGQTYHYRFIIRQRAGTFLYHPHPDKLPGPQTYRGLGGFLIVEDEKALDLPSGDYELPLLIREKRLTDQGKLVYDLNMMGFFGNSLFVNGVLSPYHEVSTRFYRLRLANMSDARIFDLSLSDGHTFHLIGTDGGLLDRPYSISSATLAPFERADVLVDFSQYKVGEKVRMTAEARNGMGGMMNKDGGGMMDGEGMMNDANSNQKGTMGGGPQNSGGGFMEFRITKKDKDPFRLPQTLTTLSFPDEAAADHTRRIDLTMEMMRGPALDGKFFKMLRADQKVQQGALEV